jgi:DNA processing protein
MLPDDTRYYLGFNLVPGIGPARLGRLVERCGSIAAAWQASPTEMAAAGLDARSCAGLLAARRERDLDIELARVLAAGLQPISLAHPAYPPLLAAAPAAPPLIYLRGAFDPADSWAVAVVGTRHPTPYGREATQRLAGDLARSGVTIVSGLAIGVDTIAHQAALEAGGRTIAVLACGLDTVYPERNTRLATQIAAQGGLVSDYPLGTKPMPLNFPPRNRIISGLSLATLVIEAGEGSGALITVEFALEQGREVFAVPGTIFSSASVGCNRLIRDGAGLVTCADDLLSALSLSRSEAQREARAELPDDPLEAAIFEQLDYQPRHIDALGRAAELPAAQAAAALVMLELKGLARQAGAQLYVRAR